MVNPDNKVQMVYITSGNQVTFTCPQCEHPRVVNLADHDGLEKATTVKVSCRECGYKYRAILERRRQFRKSVNFSGSYTHLRNGRPVDNGFMVVEDISRTGLKLRLAQKTAFAVGDKLKVEFRLDDVKRSSINKEVEIKIIFTDGLGVEFTSVHPSNPSDKALGFYMFG